MDMHLRSAGGTEWVVAEADWENLVHLLDEAGVDLVKFVEHESLDAEDAKVAGEALGHMKLEAVETVNGIRIRVVGGFDTDPMIAVLARLAEQVGDDESAERARNLLLAEASSLVVRPLNDVEKEKVAGWAKLLIESNGVKLQR